MQAGRGSHHTSQAVLSKVMKHGFVIIGQQETGGNMEHRHQDSPPHPRIGTHIDTLDICLEAKTLKKLKKHKLKEQAQTDSPTADQYPT